MIIWYETDRCWVILRNWGLTNFYNNPTVLFLSTSSLWTLLSSLHLFHRFIIPFNLLHFCWTVSDGIKIHLVLWGFIFSKYYGHLFICKQTFWIENQLTNNNEIGEMQGDGVEHWLDGCVKLIILSEQPKRSDHELFSLYGQHCPGWCLPAMQRDSYVWMEMWWDYEKGCFGRGCLCLTKTWFTAKQYAFGCLYSLVLESEGPLLLLIHNVSSLPSVKS